MDQKRKRRPKRPAMVEPIDGEFEDVIQSLFKAPPKKRDDWKYLKREGANAKRQSSNG